MYLSRLTVFGFKSFAHKIEIDFRGGITAVVGPNGCGKTNIVDAIRWAIGETRPGAMRSNRMEDVIFTGSRQRKPLGMAEVSVTISNDKKILPVEFSEVTVTRRLFRSGESDYLLNKIPCRLMDIHTLFMDTGLGAHAYSVIEQGMVDAIISDKAEDRRHIFEEAAGITRYKIRRKSAWNKLVSIQGDLQRIDDIVGEVERQVRSLQRQMRKARQYKNLADQVKEMEVSLGRHRYFELAGAARPMVEEIQFLKEEVDLGNSDLARTEARLEGVRVDLSEQDHALSSINAELSSHQTVVHAKDREISVARESIRGIEAFLERARNGRLETGQRLERVIQDLNRSQEEREETNKTLVATEGNLRDADSDMKRVQSLMEEQRSLADDDKSRLIELLGKRSERGGRLERLRGELDGLTARLAEVKKESLLTATRTEVAVRSVEMAASERRISEEQRDALQTRKTQLTEALNRAREHAGVLNQEENELKRRMEGVRARLHLLERLREGFEGFSDGVRSLVVDSPHSGDIRGVVADLIEADEPYLQALETALGRSLEALVVPGTTDAESAIRFLKEGARGTAGFWPLERINESTEEPTWEPPSEEGVIGKAVDLVRSDIELSNLVRHLLGHTLVVQDMASALAVSRTNLPKGIDLVTLDGDLLAASGMVSGGRSGGERESVGLIGRKQQINSLRSELEDGDRQLEDLSERIAEARERTGELERQLSGVEEQLSDLENGIATLERDRDKAQTEVDRLQELKVSLQEEENRIRSGVKAAEEQIEDQEKDLRHIDADREELERFAIQHDEALKHAEEAMRSRRETTNDLTLRVTTLRGRLEELEREGSRLDGEKISLGSQIEGMDSEIAEAASRKEAIASKGARDKEEMEKLHRVQTEIEKRRDSHAERYQELALSTRGLEDDIRERQRRLNKQREKLHDLELGLQELKGKADALRGRLSETHRVDVKEMGPPEDDGGSNVDLLEKRIYEFQDRMRRIGAVNMAALEDYEIQKDRYEFLNKQRNDLLEAEETLKKTIARIDRTARSRFTDTFAKIRENFQKTFVAFFEGGEADLWMETNQDPLDAPIHITARPHGKRLQHINLLSGGERSLTAIGLLFAIYLVKPSPFCILDEVDAPLDDVNIDRFTRVLRKFAADTQFIVVTHNKKTMEAAESLHGVTMEEPGVSRLVSVRIGRNGKQQSSEAPPRVETSEATEAVPA